MRHGRPRGQRQSECAFSRYFPAQISGLSHSTSTENADLARNVGPLFLRDRCHARESRPSECIDVLLVRWRIFPALPALGGALNMLITHVYHILRNIASFDAAVSHCRLAPRSGERQQHPRPADVAVRGGDDVTENSGLAADSQSSALIIAEILSPSLLPYPHPATFAGRECGIPLPRPRSEGTDHDQRSACASLRR